MAAAEMIDTPDSLWAWVTRLPDGRPSIIGVAVPGVSPWTPLVAASKEVISALRPLAEGHGDASGQVVWLARYQLAEVLEGPL